MNNWKALYILCIAGLILVVAGCAENGGLADEEYGTSAVYAESVVDDAEEPETIRETAAEETTEQSTVSREEPKRELLQHDGKYYVVFEDYDFQGRTVEEELRLFSGPVQEVVSIQIRRAYNLRGIGQLDWLNNGLILMISGANINNDFFSDSSLPSVMRILRIDRALFEIEEGFLLHIADTIEMNQLGLSARETAIMPNIANNLAPIEISISNFSGGEIGIHLPIPSVKVLNLDDTNIQNMDNVANLPNLEELSIPQANIRKITGIRDLQNLRRLSLQLNPIEDFSELAYVKDLEYVTIIDPSRTPEQWRNLGEVFPEFRRNNPDAELLGFWSRNVIRILEVLDTVPYYEQTRSKEPLGHLSAGEAVTIINDSFEHLPPPSATRQKQDDMSTWGLWYRVELESEQQVWVFDENVRETYDYSYYMSE
ncbi:leucine-rich repeat domain-containing protein [Spirochaeta africana]|uniref:Leucine Rich Repeat (LRR)-containing protein n=1 Tax=Spirochaeta africana (strain ATCC 700263 / DSM 8902 / Z-7692) TaxID=889378 RepID=H9UIH7_SPIAZ|nr:leucine-rich repeat domain-containing protein [Spirochaeta africana]AFG37320.1 hypothetical protein Spiaf_1243 [Spirochaeta africana DSM 8902]